MNTTTFFRKRNVVLFVTSSILIVAVLVSVIGRPTNMTGTTIGNNSNQNYIMITYGPNITGSVPVGPTITKSIDRKCISVYLMLQILQKKLLVIMPTRQH
jgi:hypothetical protein